MSKNTVYTKKEQIIRVAIVVLLMAFSTGYFFGFLVKDNLGLFYNVTGITLSYAAVIVAAYKIISEKTYKIRFEELSEEDAKQRLERDYKKTNVFTEEEVIENRKSFESAQDPINTELERFLEIDDVAKAHIKLSILLVALGAIFQIVGAIEGVK